MCGAKLEQGLDFSQNPQPRSSWVAHPLRWYSEQIQRNDGLEYAHHKSKNNSKKNKKESLRFWKKIQSVCKKAKNQ